MIERQETELHLLRSREPIPTVEVDMDSLPESLFGYGDTVVASLRGIAHDSEELRATIYVYQGESVNFGTYSWSAFVGIDGPIALLEPILRGFEAIPGVRARLGDSIRPSQGLCEFHIEDGRVWRPSDAITWYADDDGNDDEDNDAAITCVWPDDALETEPDLESSIEPVGAEKTSGGESPRRYRAARGDATVGSIRRNIEQVFGLPAGSVALCGPDGHALRADARIATLRRRWE